jgi:Mg2+ and Co2+ transporter CorA
MNNKKLFLLGGYDLEMLEIKSILEHLNVSYQDKKLSWEAKLSDYEEFLNFDGEIYGIELEEDIIPPVNYHTIDHHGKYDSNPSSLERVAELLHIKLTREQQLIAANDSRYIAGMKALCATKEKIEEIRKADRKTQGVTEADEELAKHSVETATSNIIFSQTPYFSAISDFVYEKHTNYVIYNEEKIVFYGYKYLHVSDFFLSQGITQENCYYGGGNFGFIGIKQNILNKVEIKNLIEEFEKVQSKEEIYSYHTFMLPFKFDTKNKKDILESWEFEPYKDNYNEIAYFHSFFQESMFVKEEENKNSAFYTKDAYKNSSYIICKSEEYKLNLKSVNLRIFKTGVGILSFHLENKTHPDVKAILEINDFGRRIYPEYLDYEKEFCGLVPNFVKMGDVEERFEFDENQTTPKLSKIIQALLPTNKITPAVDDRMFVISFYKNAQVAQELKNDYACHDKWYEYIFVDGDGITVQNKEMQKELTKKASYARWQQYGTMYGLTKYSFVCLADSDFPLKHMQTMYFQMFSLLLMVRASILKFSDEISTIADKMDEDISQDVSDIYKRYIQFVNNFYFREITAKDQGLELYEKAIDILKIERDVKDLDAEIEELHKYVELDDRKKADKENKIINEKLAQITKFGGVMMGVSVVTGIFGMNVGRTDNFSDWLVIPVIVMVGIISAFLIFKKETHE